MMNYSVVIVARDQTRPLLGTLLALRKHAQPRDVILVDNASSGDIRGMAALSQLPLRFQRFNDHTSLARAFNAGLDTALHDHILLLHGDVLIEADPAIVFSALEQDSTIGVAGAKLFQDAPPPRRLLHAGYDVGPGLNWASPIGRMDWDRFPEAREVEAVSDACMFLRRTELRFDERYWFQLQDVDFCLQYRARGYRIVSLGSMPAVHLEDGGLREHRSDPRWAAREIATRWLHHDRWSSRPAQPAVTGSAAGAYMRRVDEGFEQLGGHVARRTKHA